MGARMSLFIVDVEADGPCPGLYSMISIGAVLFEDQTKTFSVSMCPITSNWKPEALKVVGVTRKEQLGFGEPGVAMLTFEKWIRRVNGDGRPIFVSDNPAFDWQFVNYYFHLYREANPFGFSARRIGDLYSGLVKNMWASNDWKRFRETVHNHDPLADAKGNAEALAYLVKEFGLR